MVLSERQRLDRLLHNQGLLFSEGTWLFSEDLMALEGGVVIVQGCAKRVCKVSGLGAKTTAPKKGLKKARSTCPGACVGQIMLGSPELKLGDAPGGPSTWCQVGLGPLCLSILPHAQPRGPLSSPQSW